MNVALDTNVLAYAEGLNGDTRRREALHLFEQLAPESTLLPVQVLGELFVVLVKKGGRSRENARASVLEWGDAFPLIESSSDVLLGAMDLSVDHQLFVWDALIISAAAKARCRLLLSEDLHEGFTWGGVTVVNPFKTPAHPLLLRAIQE
ncbi:MAG: PIN domain-containing protein [Vicinamibacterales bacterium]